MNLNDIILFINSHNNNSYLYYIAEFVTIIFVLRVIHIIYILSLNKYLTFKPVIYSSTKEQAKKILILGDSTAVGTGADCMEDTIGGRLAHDFPDSQIMNFAKNGSTISDMERQIALAKDNHFHLIIISSGGNDTWKLTRDKKIIKSLMLVLNEAKKISNHRVIFLVNSNVSFGPFPSTIRNFLQKRNKHITEIIKSICTAVEIPTIELFTHTRNNPFLVPDNDLLAPDGIHPSSKGYGKWYVRMWYEMVKFGYTYY